MTNKDEGWLKLHRKLNQWDWKTKPLTMALFIHLLLNANHKEGTWRGQKVKAGQLITGRRKLAEYTGLSEMQIRTAIKHLKSTNDITIKTTKEYSIISICNWEKYQEGNQQNDQGITNEQPTSNQPITTNKNKNNKKNNNKPTKLDDEKNPLWWSGEVIRLNRKDYETWFNFYEGTDDQFVNFLNSKDEWYANTAPPERRKTWFMATLNQIKGMANAK